MQTNRERIYDIVKLYFNDDSKGGVSTEYIAKALNIQRTNVSSILSKLVSEGKVQKTSGRPVLYYIESESDTTIDKCFSEMIGYDGSLKRAVQLAKASVLYPQRNISTVIIGAQGTGKSLLAMLMHKFAVESKVLLPDSNCVIFDCRNYVDSEQLAINELFGDEKSNGYFAAAEHGMLCINNAHLLSSRTRSLVMSHIEKMQKDNREKSSPIVVVNCDSKNRVACDDFASSLPIVIELPPLSERPISERMQMIQNFLIIESARIKKTLCINAELLRCLLLYDCEANCLQLKGDIKIGCANAYVRERNSSRDTYQLFVSDFEHRVRKGFLKYKNHRDEIEQLIPNDYNYFFNEASIEISAAKKDKLTYKNLYDDLEHKALELETRGLQEDDINLILSTDIENIFRGYQSELMQQVINKEQLSGLVDKRVIDLVEGFLNDAALKLERSFSNSIFYGLCLHLNAAINHRSFTKKIPSKQITEIIENFRSEYSFSLRFAAKLEQIFNMKLTIDEVVFITMFISYQDPISETSSRPVILFAFYGEGVAASVAKTIESYTQLKNVFAFEIVFEKGPEEIYDRLKQYISNIERGRGVITVYDNDFLGKMLSSIEEELKIVIRQCPIPILTLGIELARQAALDENVDNVYHRTMKSVSTYSLKFKKIIVTLCTTGEGGAKELQRYIRLYGQVDDMEIIPLSILDRDCLREELVKIMNMGVIHCVIGAHNPKLFELPFIPISDVFSVEKEKLPALLRLTREEKRGIDYNEIYSYLTEQLEHVNIDKLKKVLPKFISEINDKICELSLDSELGLFIHMACCIDRTLGHTPAPVNIRREDIIGKHNRQYKELLKLLRPLEKTFSIIFDNNEAANILTIIYKL